MMQLHYGKLILVRFHRDVIGCLYKHSFGCPLSMKIIGIAMGSGTDVSLCLSYHHHMVLYHGSPSSS